MNQTRSRTYWMLCSLCASFILHHVSAISNSLHHNKIMQFNSAAVEPTIDPNSVCLRFQELSTRQQSICRRHPHATATAMQGLRLAVHECRRQFYGHRWNCSNLDTSIAATHPFVNRGFKEAAFSHAIAAAGILHQVAISCSMGKIDDCSCQNHIGMQVKGDFQWRGCSHDLRFGSKYSRRFLTPRDGAVQTIQTMMQAHNSKLGRKVVLNQKSTKCKCHGMSSSCELKTCWLSTPDLRKVGDKLKLLYDKSVMVDRTNSVKGNIIPVRAIESNDIRSKSRVERLKKKMVYYENSPTYCDSINELGAVGTSGRVCNRTSTDTDSCGSLCCGRGFFTVRVHRVEKCNCRFYWCCYVRCERCEHDEWVTVCR